MNIKKLTILAVVTVASLLVRATGARAAEWHVPGDFATIQAAIQSKRDGRGPDRRRARFSRGRSCHQSGRDQRRGGSHYNERPCTRVRADPGFSVARWLKWQHDQPSTLHCRSGYYERCRSFAHWSWCE